MTSKILRSDGVTELSGIKSVTYTETVNAGEGLRPGCVASSSINVECYGAQSDAPAQDEALTYYRVVNGVETLVGIFYAEPSIPSKGTYKFVAYDAVAKLDVGFSARLNEIQNDFPMTVYDLVSEACSVAGVTLGSSSWPLSTQTVQAFYTDNLTCRNILQYAAEIACRFARCNTSGEVVFGWYTTNSTSIYPGGNDNTKVAYKQNGLTYDNTNVYVVDSVAIKPSGVEGAAYIYPTSYSAVTASDPNSDGNIILTNLIASDLGNGELLLSVEAEDDNTDGNVEVGTQTVTVNPMIFSDNLLLTNASDATYLAVAQNIYDTMSALPSYRHSTSQLFVDENPFHAGEFVSVTDAQGVTFNTPVFTMTVAASGATLQSSGKAKYQMETTTSLAKTVANLASNIVQIDKLKVGWAEIQEAIVQYLKLWGLMEVFKDETLTVSGGQLGYMEGNHGFADGTTEVTEGMSLVKETPAKYEGSTLISHAKTHYIIITDGGIRMTEATYLTDGAPSPSDPRVKYNAYLADGVFRADNNVYVGAAGRDAFLRLYRYDGLHRDVDYYSIPQVIWENASPTSTFASQTLSIPTIQRFNAFIVCFRRNTQSTYGVSWFCHVPDTVTTGFDVFDVILNNNLEIEARQRNMTISRETNEVYFSLGWLNGNSSGNGNILIPTRILGINVPDEMLHAGTLADPIVYEKNIRLIYGNYYTQYGVTYLCIRNTNRIMYADLSTMVGTYVEVV